GLRCHQSCSSSWGREQGGVRRLGICAKRQESDAGGKNQNDQSEADHGGLSQRVMRAATMPPLSSNTTAGTLGERTAASSGTSAGTLGAHVHNNRRLPAACRHVRPPWPIDPFRPVLSPDRRE